MHEKNLVEVAIQTILPKRKYTKFPHKRKKIQQDGNTKCPLELNRDNVK